MTKRTKRAVLIGDPVAHSRSPLIHEHWLKWYGLDGAYHALQVKAGDVPAQLDTLKRLGYVGCNVTIPHKEQVCSLVDDKDVSARRMGAVNVVVFRQDGSSADGSSFGMNTDGYGFMEALRAQLGFTDGDIHQSLEGKSVVIIGAGGAARAIFWALAEATDDTLLKLVNRDEDKGRTLVAQNKRARFFPWQQLAEAVHGAGLIVNTTSVGMQGCVDWHDVGVDWKSLLPKMAAGAVGAVCDIVYSPLRTSFLRAGEQCGLRCVDGLGMLVHQARLSFQAFFGVLPDVDEDIYRVVKKSLAEKP
ncbi:MAG: shikimate dehydrogenase [Alphaproteobacteria bacterium GM202ARS2]|nr:shikimate dehydrogenase [Alphaproteobacteria bacterium GM202ARS2]